MRRFFCWYEMCESFIKKFQEYEKLTFCFCCSDGLCWNNGETKTIESTNNPGLFQC